MENGTFIEVLPIKMVIFNSYVSLPEGKWNYETPTDYLQDWRSRNIEQSHQLSINSS